MASAVPNPKFMAHILPNGTAIIPANDDYTQQIQQAATQHHILAYGGDGRDGSAVYATDVQLQAQSARFVLHTPEGQAAIDLPFAGAHNVQNACAAAAFAHALGVSLADIQKGLASAQGAKGRLNFIQKNQHLLIDDTYNANPTSMRAAAEVLSQQAGYKLMVIGDIAELGDSTWAEHEALGHDLVGYDIQQIIAVGEFAAAAAQGAARSPHASKLKAFATQAEALAYLKPWIAAHAEQPTAWLFKGSRYTRMELLLDAVMETL